MKTPIEIISTKRLLIKDGIEWVPLEQAAAAMYEYHNQFETSIHSPLSEEDKDRLINLVKDELKDEEMIKCSECGEYFKKKPIILKGDIDTCDNCLCPE